MDRVRFGLDNNDGRYIAGVIVTPIGRISASCGVASPPGFEGMLPLPRVSLSGEGMSLQLLKFGGGSVDDYAMCRSS